MVTTSEETNPPVAAGDPGNGTDVAPEVTAPSGGWLRLSNPRSAITTEMPLVAPRDWLVPGADEVFRGVYTRAVSGAPEILAVCSAIAGEGKTTLSLGLGVTIAQDYPDRRVLVVETDFQKPILAKDFGIDPTPGLADCLHANRPIQVAYRPTFLGNLHLLPAGGPVANPGRLLRSSLMVAAIEAMRRSHDVVILDVPALLNSSNSLLLTDLADGTIFVVRSGVTPTTMVHQAIDQLDEEKLRGMVLNGAQSAIPGWLRRLCGL